MDSKIECFCKKIKATKHYDKNKEREVVDSARLRNKDAREIGAEWMCKQALDQLGRYDFFVHFLPKVIFLANSLINLQKYV
ncbi:MAG: hypothetical protein A2275_09605 [Bacteroidetes bacterium RIFOXYA12_FULL_35_11]|nr:MAG: hypothetical protein A2X01_17570 [Bacteroidetes bacterium GWF2_35_48]OFY74529.1 MAG: hypothetical protein A2275_09605 [Bacteroidetes bacterium RIFOXYA12_FULL_35_11]OFY94320.1 MAG: hypothetical protein A2491_00630 [Bacteroidetes bacterium RIFOXYC12_FULL_35_7]HBX49641.1 hypothetical protein [Bacteroidales bacterium]